jgi:hypothetical protein
MRSARALALAVSAIELMAACTSGQMQVQGLPDVTGPADTNIPGFGNFFEIFRKGEQLPIVPGSDRC